VPVVGFLLLPPLLGNAPPFCLALMCGQHAQRLVHLLALEPFDVPVCDLGPIVFVPALRRDDFSESLGVLEHGAIVVLKYCDELFVMVEGQVDELGFVVEGIADHPIKEPWIGDQHASHEPFGGIEFGLVRPYRLSIQWQRDLVADKMADNDTVIILGDLFARYRNGARRALGT